MSSGKLNSKVSSALAPVQRVPEDWLLDNQHPIYTVRVANHVGWSNEHHRHSLNEHTKAIKKCFGINKKELEMETDAKTALTGKFRKRIEQKIENWPAQVIQVINEWLSKLKSLDTSSSEFNVALDHLDWLTALPWGEYSDENFDVNHALKILNEHLYGLADVKERVLEFIAIWKLTGKSQGRIICLCGPPGVGKTSIAQSIASALNRKFYRFSVRDLADMAEIRGHWQTYRGAIPGKMVQCLKHVGTANPVVLIDEIDKLCRGRDGDPAYALLELLDPEQNANFLDHYLRVPIDLSKVLFVCTANDVENIPDDLLYRMEVITVAGYITDEKMHIARDYLEKTARESCGIKPQQVEVTDAALLALIENYCLEDGVKSLQKLLETIYRKIALQLVRKAETIEPAIDIEKVLVDKSNLADFVGKPLFHAKHIYDRTPIGVVMGLAWTAMGSSTLYIKTTLIEERKGKGALCLTGQMGGAIEEVSQIAHTVASVILREKEPKNTFFADSKLHLHVPIGATPKDGASFACTMITSLLSLAMKKPVKKNLAIAGYVTLSGKILPISWVKEKTIAARRSKVKTIIFPSANRSEFEALAVNVKEGLEVHFVDDYMQISNLAFSDQ